MSKYFVDVADVRYEYGKIDDARCFACLASKGLTGIKVFVMSRQEFARQIPYIVMCFENGEEAEVRRDPF